MSTRKVRISLPRGELAPRLRLAWERFHHDRAFAAIDNERTIFNVMRALSQTIPTLEEVADLAGVSRATASRVITGNPRVSPTARRAVERAARKLGYVPNRAARSLVRRRTDSIGLVIPEPTTQLFGDPFFPRLVRGVNEEAAARGFQLVLFTPQTPSDEDRLEQYVVGGHVDGVLLVSLHGDDPLPKHFAERRVHAVVGGRPPADAPVSFVDIDNEGGARQAVRHLLSRGRRRIGTIAGRMDMPVSVDRLAGYRAELAAAGIAHDPRLEAVGDFTAEGGSRAHASAARGQKSPRCRESI